MPTRKLSTLSKMSYNTLVRLVRGEIERARRAIERRTVETYWTVGASMKAYLGDNPAWGAEMALFRRLSKGTGIDTSTLNRSLQFARAYPELNLDSPLSWSHYRILVAIEDPAARARWERRAVREGLTIDRLYQLVVESKAPKLKGPAAQLPVPPRGLLYHYRLVKVDYVNDLTGGLMLDCGFDCRIVPPPFSGTLTNKSIFRAEKDAERYSIVKTNVRVEKIYTYCAVIDRVVDGDTLLANIDVGFGLWTEQYLRLVGIDAPELRDPGGLRVRDHVRRALAHSPFVIVRTHKRDSFGRRLADIYYLPKEPDPHRVAADGKYLNQELLDHGLAEVWKG